MKSKIYSFCLLLLCFAGQVKAQGLLDELDEIAPVNQNTLTTATFKTTRVINGQSVEQIAVKELNFIIQHRFGPVSNGAIDLFGLDQAQIRFGFEYGLTDRINVAVGRNSFQKTYDGQLKVKLLRQEDGKGGMPLTLSYFGATFINGLPYANQNRENYFSSRMSYVHQLLIARKFNSSFSLQLTPGIVHKNLVPLAADANVIPHIGGSGRYKLSNRIAVNVEYFAALNDRVRQNSRDALSVGLDIETGGHVFQLHFTNATGMFERSFITETQGDWSNGDILFGFNVNRVFNLEKENGKKMRKKKKQS